MQTPTSDHLWALADHFLAALPYAGALFYWARRRFKALIREAVREEIRPMKERVEEIDSWYQVVSRAFGKKANGHYAGAD
jgi:hypothetical protein